MPCPCSRSGFLPSLFMAVLILGAGLCVPAQALSAHRLDTDPAKDVLYQISTIAKLKAGYYDSEQTVTDLLERGDFGIGTFQGLDGEMFVRNGQVWQIPVTGTPKRIRGGLGVPFAQVTYFEPDLEFTFKYVADYDDFKKRLLDELPGPDMLYAVHVSGTFQYVQARSVPASQQPFPSLAEVIERQAVFPLHNRSGHMVGWHTPHYMTGVGAPGLHLHFLDDMESAGGHVLDFSAAEVTIQLDVTPVMEIRLPKNTAF
ncbi:acetolactate decarboxylase [Paucidesulfovibrio gracilis DSM 16080]|uniref:Alpha-acetolactate decarboxylase n=1 Tax=Paucidesulfovibrio gracilis DSM 16080 TaxID=1121449 RepID=A0A1T4Y400_9BACT|nr:acetolactate decarboxylase [Paucidesulfovibrio gracilis]SKA96466.1 acetolactate decarboxylase [Paucidesulfovibrio gracilis DSM 16080]